MSGIVGSRLNIRGSGLVGSLGTDGQAFTSSGTGVGAIFEDAGGAVSALNNATQSELVSIGSTTTELDAEANLTFTGSALTCIGTVTVGVDNTGHDVKYFGATTGKYFEWDESADQVNVVGNTLLKGNLTVGVNDTGHDVKFFGATASKYMLWDESQDNLNLKNGVGLLFGSQGGTYEIGMFPYVSDQGIQLVEGQAHTADGNEAWHLWWGPQPGAVMLYQIRGEEGQPAFHRLNNDEQDDNIDYWHYGALGTSFDVQANFFWCQRSAGSYDNEMQLQQDGDLITEGTMTASTATDYAEFFEWDTELTNDQAVKDTYGLSVVLVNDKIRLAVEGEEADVIGVVRPNSVSACVGGTQTFMWKDRYLRDVWGEKIKEQYTDVKWYDLNDDGTKGQHYHFSKDRIPPYKIKKEDVYLDMSEHDWYLNEKNYITDEDGNFIPLVVPSTDEEKAATEYQERNVYRRDKGQDGMRIGDPLLRNVINTDYVSVQNYVPRDKRRKEWCIVGLIGQVPVRDTAIIPTHWKLMRNLESGINMYYVK